MIEIDALTARLSAVIAERLRAPGEVLGLARLTGGATKATWGFDHLIRTVTDTLRINNPKWLEEP